MGVSQVAMGLVSTFQAVKQIGSIWSDDDLDMGEKILQILSNILLIAPTFVSTIQGMRTLTT